MIRLFKQNHFSAVLILGVIALGGCAGQRQHVAVQQAESAPVVAHKPPVIGGENLAAAIDALLADPVLATATTGVHVVNLTRGEVVYARNAKKLFHPASNMKLFTSVAALVAMGPEHRLITRAAIDSAAVPADTLRSPIWLIGSGDPEFTLGDMAAMVEQLVALGITTIDGDIICDATALDSLYMGEGWMWDDKSSWFWPPLSAMVVNRNTVEFYLKADSLPGAPARFRTVPAMPYFEVVNSSISLTRDSLRTLLADTTQRIEWLKAERRWQKEQEIVDITGYALIGAPEKKFTIEVVDAARYFGSVFRELCRRAGIRITGTIRRGQAPENARVIAGHASPPMSSLLTAMNKPSDNLHAELLLKLAGAAAYGPPGTAEKGIRVIKDFLGQAGIDTATIRFSDGSGVSRYNLVTPETITGLLRAVHERFAFSSEFIASLPIAGVDGTLDDRMHGSAAEGVLHAKTGSLSGVSTLAGYVPSADGDLLAFSIMMSHFTGDADARRRVQDRICDVLARFSMHEKLTGSE